MKKKMTGNVLIHEPEDYSYSMPDNSLIVYKNIKACLSNIKCCNIKSHIQG